MKRFKQSCLLALFVMWLFGSQIHVAAGQSGTQDVLYLGPQQIYRMRIQVTIQGDQPDKFWEASIAKLFDALDKDENGVLNGSEIESAPTPVDLFQAGILETSAHTPITVPESGTLSKADVLKYYKSLARDGVSVLAGPRRPVRPSGERPLGGLAVTSGVFETFDLDGNGKLVAGELASAYTALKKYDLNDDEIISNAELGLGTARVGPARPDQPRMDTIRFVLWDKDVKKVVDPIIKRYDLNSDSKLSSTERKAAGFSDNDQMDLYLQLKQIPVSIFLMLNVDKSATVKIETKKSVARVNPLQPDLSVLMVDGSHIDVASEASAPFAGDSKRFKDLFAQTDSDKNGYLSIDEVRRFRSFRRAFEAMDRNSDDKVVEQELVDYVAVQSLMSNARVVLRIDELGSDIAQVLDSNRDQQLGRLEIQRAVKRMKDWDEDKDGGVSESEVPMQARISVGREELILLAERRARSPNVREEGVISPSGAAPKWFRKMDSNRDGVLSRREFLGRRAIFNRYDRDGDGLLTPKEARSQ